MTEHIHGNPYPQEWNPYPATRSDKMIIVMVGLPARGKSYISRRLSQYLSFFYGVPCKVFNVGNYRRQSAGAYQKADFFDPQNERAVRARTEASVTALNDLAAWMEEVMPARLESDAGKFVSGDFGALALFDATNTTVERRQWIMEQVKPIGARIMFLESICTDEELIHRNILTSKVGVKDYAGVDADEAVKDFRERISQYQKVYVSLSETDEKHLSWIKMVRGFTFCRRADRRRFLSAEFGLADKSISECRGACALLRVSLSAQAACDAVPYVEAVRDGVQYGATLLWPKKSEANGGLVVVSSAALLLQYLLLPLL
eukprot:6197850-Pleurochrysis_carterae.AAC.2